MGWTRPSRLCTVPHVAIPMVTTSASLQLLLRLKSRTASPTCFITPVWDPPVIIQAPGEGAGGGQESGVHPATQTPDAWACASDAHARLCRASNPMFRGKFKETR